MAAVEPSADLLQAQVLAYHHGFSIVRSMALKCAVELGIPEIIHSHGQPMALSELHTALHIDAHKRHALRRLMRLLEHMGCFLRHDHGDGEEAYDLTTFSRLLLKDHPNSCSQMLLTMLAPMYISLWSFVGAWLTGDEPSPFHMAFGKSMWDAAADDPAFNDSVNRSMAGDSGLVGDAVVRECGDAFQGLRTLVDVGGGTGSMARAIAAAFPGLKCTVLDLPHVVASAPAVMDVEFVGGDMFDHIPHADAVLLKCVLHDWDDDDCVKILKQCKAAIPSRGDGGKVFVLEMVVNSSKADPKLTEAQYFFDIGMMLSVEGKERDEAEWRKLFTSAGFTDYKINYNLGLRSLIEVYP
uniref:8-hydroxyquercetin 8-O-methyltransferase n=1 Tax=Anthurium amnicola TaxID=1678845 RepID=A0A1D1Z8E5_9ARAE